MLRYHLARTQVTKPINVTISHYSGYLDSFKETAAEHGLRVSFPTRIRSVERGICPIAAVCTVGLLLSWSRDPGHANVSETFLRGHVATIPGTCLSNLKFVPLAVLELLAFNAQTFTGSRDRDHAHFLETFVRSHVGTIPGNTPAKFEVRIFSRFRAISS